MPYLARYHTDLLPDTAFLDTSSYESSRTLDQLPEFLKAFSPNKGAGLSKSSEEKGTPHTLVVCGAALRAAEVVRWVHPSPRAWVVTNMFWWCFNRALRPLQNKESTVGKLFAKHIKLEDAKQFLQRARYAYTPSYYPPLILPLYWQNKSMGLGVGTPARISDLIDSGTFYLHL